MSQTQGSYKLGRGNTHKLPGRPKKPRKSVIVSISMPPYVYTVIDKLAQQMDKSFSATVVELVSKAVNVEVKV